MTAALAPVADTPRTGLRADQAQREIEALLGRESAGESEIPATDPKKPEPVKEPEPKADAATAAEPEPDKGADDGDAGDPAADDPALEAGKEAAPDADGQEEPEALKIPVKVAGETVEVTLDELIRGYSREADYTRKTQALATQRAEQEAAREKFNSETEAVRQERAKYAELLGKLEAEVTASLPQDVDWEKLRREDPDGFAVQWADHEYRKVQQARVRTELESTQQRIVADLTVAHEKHVATEAAKLMEAIPELKDPAKRDAVRSAMAEYATSNGFAVEDLDSVVDHRVLVMIDKARRFDAQQAQAAAVKAALAAKIAKASKTAVPGSQGEVASRVTTELTRQKQRLAKTGRRDDAARAIELLLASGDEA